ncbi:MAG: glycosyltransferase [Acidimicrobiia bacterium]|nr:glycosyltransferase [Acidimicrobiia bacterium]MDH5502670.1 glycosyltransferase [Acidimicrobiia bacterium]
MIAGVFSVVHHADDVRIREKLIPTLANDFTVEYHTRTPSPSQIDGFTWHAFRGSRLMRNVSLLLRLMSRRFDVAVLVDPETFLAGILASRRTNVVFDIHENVPAQIGTKNVPFKKALSRLAVLILKAAEKAGTIVLAEPGYAELFSREHPVFENFPRWEAMPPMAPGDGSVIYVGDITEQRGALHLAEAVAGTDKHLVMIGRCSPELASRIESVVGNGSATVELTGRLPWRAAMARLASAAVAVSPLTDTPNYRHSLPTKVLEYLGLGVPVVATNLPGTTDVLTGRPGVTLVAPGDVPALRQAIHSASRAEVRQAAQDSAAGVRADFEWPTERVRGFYTALVGEPGFRPDR